MSKSIKTGIPRFETVYADDYKIIFPDGSVGGTKLGVFNQVIYSDELRAEKTLSSTPPDPQKIYVKRTIHCQLVMTPHQAKNLAQHIRINIIESVIA